MIKEMVEYFLPDSNFYCFKLDDDFDEDREEKEQMEIQRLIEDAIRHQGRVIRLEPGAGDGDSSVLPILPVVLEP